MANGAAAGERAKTKNEPTPRQKAKSRLDAWIFLWHDTQDEINHIKAGDRPEGTTEGGTLEDLREAHEDVERKIQRLLSNRPGLAGYAREQGFTAFKETPAKEERRRDGREEAAGGGGGGAGGAAGGEGGGGGKRNPQAGGGGGSIDHLPGKRGRDYYFVRGPGGQVHVVFKMDIPGKRGKTNVSYRIPNELHDRYGIDRGNIRRLTKAQMKRLNGFGPINELRLRRGEHPFNSWLREMKRKFGVAPGMLRDKQVMEVLFAAHLGKWDQAELMGELQKTKWYKTKTSQRINWIFEKNPADRKTSINAATNAISDHVRSTFGGIDPTQHGLNEDKIKKWAKRMASGATGWDETEVTSRIDEIARGIKGTPLYAQEEEAAATARAFPQKWEDVREDLREQANAWLGPRARPDGQTLTSFAKQLFSGEVVQADFDRWIRRQKQALYPFIDPKTPWQDFASSYRQVLEETIGTTVEWSDRSLQNLQGTDEQGKPTGAPMSVYDYAQFIRDNDPRFWQNPQTEERGRQFAQGVMQLMTGGAG